MKKILMSISIVMLLTLTLNSVYAAGCTCTQKKSMTQMDVNIHTNYVVHVKSLLLVITNTINVDMWIIIV